MHCCRRLRHYNTQWQKVRKGFRVEKQGGGGRRAGETGRGGGGGGGREGGAGKLRG